MKAILIDSREMDVREVDIPLEGGDYSQIAEAIGCELFTVAQYLQQDTDTPDVLFVDDEGLLHNPEHFFSFNGQPLCGNGLILGTTYDGDSTAPTVTTDEVCAMVRWLDKHDFRIAHDASVRMMREQAEALNAAHGGKFVIVTAPDSQEVFGNQQQ